MERLSDLLPKAREVPPTWTPGNGMPTALNNRGIPEMRLGDRFETFDLKRNPEMEPAFKQAFDVASGAKRCALLAGGFGNGKTHLAIAALNLWREEHETGYFWKVPDFLAWIKRSFDDPNLVLEDQLSAVGKGRALVVFDDLGAENRTDWAAEQMFRVLDARYDAKAPTILTTNTAIDRIDGRLLSRYREGLVVCRGRDVR